MIRKIIEKIRYWIAKPYIKKYYDKHIGVSMVSKIITTEELMLIPAQRRNDFIDYHFKSMTRSLIEEALKNGAVIMKKEKDAFGERLEMRIKYWI